MATNAREQFIQDFFMVADNDQRTYQELQEIGREFYDKDDLNGLGEQLETWWEFRVQEMTEQVKDISNVLFIQQMFIGWGSDTWHSIASQVWDSIVENEEAN